MSTEKNYLKKVELHEKAKNLNRKLSELKLYRNFIFENYDSKISVQVEAISCYDCNDETFAKISVPTEVILQKEIAKKFILEQLDLEIKSIEENLDLFDKEFYSL